MRTVACAIAVCVSAWTVGCSPDAPPPAKSGEWSLVFAEDFSDDGYEKNWRLEGFADLAVKSQGDVGYLEVRTIKSPADGDLKQSVLWCRKKFTGDLRFVFRARGETRNRSIFYFNANPTKSSGHQSIFEWPRPDADMRRYAGSGKIEMYSVGILRDDQRGCNLRYIGGDTHEAYLKRAGGSQVRYGKATIIRSYGSPFLGKPETWFEFDLRIVGKRIRMSVDGAQVLDVVDPGNLGSPEYAWTALTDGGFFAFRNFMPRSVCIDYVRVYRRN